MDASSGAIDPRVTATPVALDPSDPARDRVGALHYLGGWVLHGRDSRFGGFSSLVVAGDRFLTVSDTGSFLNFRFDGRRVTGSAISELDLCPARCATKQDRDAESTARDPATGTTWIGFENSNEIWRYDATLTHATGHAASPAMRRWPLNRGPESVVRLRDGRFLVIGENDKGPKPKTSPLLLFAGDPVDHPEPAAIAGYRPPAGFDPSDATELPDGRIMILNRRVTLSDGFVSAITVIDPKAIRAGEVLDGREIARLEPPLTVDNMEGVSAQTVGGRTIVWMISDDNFMPFERTLLLEFALDETPGR